MNAPFILNRDKPFRRIPVGQISRNPGQPRRIFDRDALEQLADSIARFGVITPLTVRKADGGYELIAGERRLRAAKLAGLSAVPCYILEADDEGSSLMALIENLQRRDLDCFEEAQSLQRLTQLYGMTQEQAAQRIGKTQSAVANKLRLLRLAPETVLTVRTHGLTERHARALLRITDPEAQSAAALHIARQQMNVAQAERYIDQCVTAAPPRQKRRVVVRDVKIFLNTIDRAVSTMRQAGFNAQLSRRQEGEDILLTVKIPAAYHGNSAVSRETAG